MNYDLNDFKTDDIPLVSDYLNRFPKYSCDFNITNLYTWGSFYHLKWFIWKECFVIYNPYYHFITFPLGEGFLPEDIHELVTQFREYDAKVQLYLMPAAWREAHPEIHQFFTFKCYDDWSDYVYAIEKLVTLSGKKLAKKKNLISQFKRQFPDYQVLRLSPSDKESVLKFFQLWQNERELEGKTIETEYKAVQKTFELWNVLPVDGLLIKADGQIIGCSIFSRQTQDMVTQHFEKFDPTIKGSAQTIIWETAKYLCDRYIWLNREQDMGIEGLRQAKRSYVPEFMVSFCTSRLKR